jgi:hypothetical protein
MMPKKLTKYLTHIISVTVATFVLGACQVLPVQADVPAKLVNTTAQARAQLATAVAQMLGVPSVALADNALTDTNTLIIEKTRPRDASGQQISGRDFGKPEIFKLVKRGDICVLIHERTASRITLNEASCTVINH